MPARFSEVVKGLLYRGGAPEPWEVKTLKDVYGIEQIISLDAESASRIADAVKKMA
jgi:protein tyrosine/serine phosphatase